MESKENPSSLTVYLPEKARTELMNIANNTGLSQSHLVVLAKHSLIANYKTKGNTIFSELLEINSKFTGNKLQKQGLNIVLRDESLYN